MCIRDRTGHVAAALLRKVHEAKQHGAGDVEIWGTGRPRREFIHADDLADATIHLVRHYSGASHVNVGPGEDVTILELAETIADVVGWTGELRLDPSRPDGTPRKVLDVSLLHALGWDGCRPLPEGLAATYEAFLRSDDT